MPIQARALDAIGVAFRVGLPHGRAWQEEVADDHDSAHNVQPVQAGEREIDRVERALGRHVAVVEFGDKVRAKTLLAGGQSGDPDSPHFDDQAQRYVDRAFKDVAYYKEDIERRAQRSYHPGEGINESRAQPD